ncbi:cytochrome c oxidase assembly protein COX16-domain-containing protein [Lipomyces kononenkoae]
MTALITSIARHSARNISPLARYMISCQFSTSRVACQNTSVRGQAQSFTADSQAGSSSSASTEEPVRPKVRRRIVFEHEVDSRPEWLQSLTRQRDKVMAIYIKLVKKQPFIFYGGPFLTLIVVASYYLQEFTEIRYKAHDQKKQMATEDDLDPRKNSTNSSRFRNETREEYYKRNYKLLQSEATEDYEIKRIERRPGDPPVKW